MDPKKQWPGLDDTGAWPEDKWRTFILNELKEGEAQMNVNTRLTAEIKSSVDTLTKKIDRLEPVAEFSDKVRKGFEVIGWVGAAMEWIAKRWVRIVIVAAAVKIMLSSGDFDWERIKELLLKPLD